VSYYHVLLTFRNAPHETRCVFSDLSERALREQFLRPYGRGTTMLAGTEVIDTMDIHKTTIIKTNLTNEEERQEIRKAYDKRQEEQRAQPGTMLFMGPTPGYDLEDIVEAGSEVTGNYITSPPGHQRDNLLSSVINHPWISAIVTGLLVAGLAKALGWV
jgi:hypothetical protein